jgi:hypothetical protein
MEPEVGGCRIFAIRIFQVRLILGLQLSVGTICELCQEICENCQEQLQEKLTGKNRGCRMEVSGIVEVVLSSESMGGKFKT